MGELASALQKKYFTFLEKTEDANEIRSRLRYRRAFLTGITSLLAKLVVLATTIICVPLTYQYLGADRYGLWMTITSGVLFLGFADFGLGNGLASAIAEADGHGDTKMAHRQVSSSFFLLLGIAGVLLAIFASVYQFVPWAKLYHSQTPLAAAEAGPATAVLVICTAINMPLGTVLRVQMGYQQGYIGDLWNALGNLLALGGVVLGVKLGVGLLWLVAALAGAPLLATGLNWMIQFTVIRPWLWPRIDLIEWASVNRLLRTGFLFFIQQCCGLVYYVSDNIVIAQTLDSSHVAKFAVFQRIFSLGLISQYFMMPLWPAFGEALARRDFEWAKRTVRKALLGNLVFGGICGLILLGISGSIIRRWTGTDPGPIDWLQIGFALWVVLVGYVAAMNSFLNHRGMMPRHLVFFGGAAFVALVLKIYLVHYWSLAGIVWATLISFGVLYVIPAARLATVHIGKKIEDSHKAECL